MKVIILSVVFLILSGCSNSENEPPVFSYPYVESETEPLVHEYESLFKTSVDYPVYLENTKTGLNSKGYKILGLCIIQSNGERSVYINKDWWNTKTESERKVLLYHELTHCSFSRSHDDRKYPNGMPYSIMSSIINPVLRFYNKYERYYLNEIIDPEVGLEIPTQSAIFTTTEDSCLFKE